jgi:single-stranded-DNA-specific exonuclease
MKKYRVRERAHDDLVTDLLHARGIVEADEAARFLTPDYGRDSHDPFLLPDMEAAVARIEAALERGERVAVWSDYDCDGIPGGVMLSTFLRRIGLAVQHYIPHRHEEGYGLNSEGIEELAQAGTKLIITVDLGTTDHEAIAFAKQKGIEVIVTDHHLVAGGLPPALAVINPKRPDSKYPFDGLCGAGVAWKLVQGVLARNRYNLPEGHEKWLLDLVGIATLSDMVPLRGENRMLARYGLLVARRARRPGLAALLSLLRIKPHTLTEDDIGFMVAPRINAASRMGDPHIAAQLLGSEDTAQAQALARQLQALNDERKGLVAATVKEANKRLKNMDLTKSPVIVMGNPAWRPGILGLVANTLAEAHGRPVFLWGREGGELLRGSCRAGSAVNLVELMGAAGDVFDHFGGHSASGGFAVLEERAHELPVRLAHAHEAVSATHTEAPETVIDRALELAEASRAQAGLEKLAPFGTGFEKPLFMFPNVSVGGMRTFGKAGDHLELSLARGGEILAGVSFFSTPESFSKKVSPGLSADIVGNIERDWRGRPRLRVVDVI